MRRDATDIECGHPTPWGAMREASGRTTPSSRRAQGLLLALLLGWFMGVLSSPRPAGSRAWAAPGFPRFPLEGSIARRTSRSEPWVCGVPSGRATSRPRRAVQNTLATLVGHGISKRGAHDRPVHPSPTRSGSCTWPRRAPGGRRREANDISAETLTRAPGLSRGLGSRPAYFAEARLSSYPTRAFRRLFRWPRGGVSSWSVPDDPFTGVRPYTAPSTCLASARHRGGHGGTVVGNRLHAHLRELVTCATIPAPFFTAPVTVGVQEGTGVGTGQNIGTLGSRLLRPPRDSPSRERGPSLLRSYATSEFTLGRECIDGHYAWLKGIGVARVFVGTVYISGKQGTRSSEHPREARGDSGVAALHAAAPRPCANSRARDKATGGGEGSTPHLRLPPSVPDIAQEEASRRAPPLLRNIKGSSAVAGSRTNWGLGGAYLAERTADSRRVRRSCPPPHPRAPHRPTSGRTRWWPEPPAL
jgi:hypothetical protein